MIDLFTKALAILVHFLFLTVAFVVFYSIALGLLIAILLLLDRALGASRRWRGHVDPIEVLEGAGGEPDRFGPGRAIPDDERVIGKDHPLYAKGSVYR